MKKPRTAARKPTRAPAAAPPTPVALRTRHDGWTPARQTRFLEALAESGCVQEACETVGLTRASAYRLRMRVDAQAFRMAWEAALDLAIRRLSDECYARAMNGEPIPHFYKGERIGEHRRYDNRLAMFLLRYRDPLRYAASLDQMVYSGHAEQAALAFAKARDRAVDMAEGVAAPIDETAPPPMPPYTTRQIADELVHQKEDALIESNAPVYGSHDRRWRIQQARRERHLAQQQAAAREAGAACAAADGGRGAGG